MCHFPVDLPTICAAVMELCKISVGLACQAHSEKKDLVYIFHENWIKHGETCSVMMLKYVAC